MTINTVSSRVALFFFSSRRRHTRYWRDWSSDVCSSDLGRQKVTGGAIYAAEFDVPGQAHGAIVRSTVANGRIASIDSAAAERASGVIAVLTHQKAPRLAYREHKGAVDPEVGERLHVRSEERRVGNECRSRW